MAIMKNIKKIIAWEKYILAHLAVIPILVWAHTWIGDGFTGEILKVIYMGTILHWFFMPAYVPDIQRTIRELRFFLIQLALFSSVVLYESNNEWALLPKVLLCGVILIHWYFRHQVCYLKYYPRFLKILDQNSIERIYLLNDLKRLDKERAHNFLMLRGLAEIPEGLTEDDIYGQYIESLEGLKDLLNRIQDCKGFYTESERLYWLGYVMFQYGVGAARLQENSIAETYLGSAMENITQFEMLVPYYDESFADIVSQVTDEGYLSALQVVPSLAAVVSEDSERQDEARQMYEALLSKYVPVYEGFPELQAAAYRKVGQYYMYQNFNLKRAQECFEEGISIMEQYTSLEETLNRGSTILLEMKDLLANIYKGEESEAIREEIEPYQHLNTWSQTFNLNEK